MSMRRVLPTKRRGETLDFMFRGAPYTVTYTCFPEGGLAEVFIDHRHSAKMSHGLEPLNADAKDAAVCLSIALQFGADAQSIRSAVNRLSDGSATGLIGEVLDLLAELESKDEPTNVG